MTAPFIKLSMPSGITTISDIKFELLSRNHLLISSWENVVLLYDCNSAISHTGPIVHIPTESTPLCLLHGGPGSLYVGFLDGSLGELDYENHKLRTFGVLPSIYDTGVNYLRPILNQPSCVVATCVGGQISVLDTRQKRVIVKHQVRLAYFKPKDVTQKAKIFAMDTSSDRIVLGLDDNSIHIYDVRNILQPLEARAACLNHQIRDIHCHPSKPIFAVSTIDGRVLIESLQANLDHATSDLFAFRCHRIVDKVMNVDDVYPVNSLAFHNVHATLITAGSDGDVCLWDCDKRKRIKAHTKINTTINGAQSVCKINLSWGNEFLAVGTSSDQFLRAKSISEMRHCFDTEPAALFLKRLNACEFLPRA